LPESACHAVAYVDQDDEIEGLCVCFDGDDFLRGALIENEEVVFGEPGDGFIFSGNLYLNANQIEVSLEDRVGLERQQ
jgi:hypothetical protein